MATVTMTTTTTTTPVLSADSGYAKTRPGIFKLIEIVFCVVCLLCIAFSSYSSSASGWFYFVASIALSVTIILLFCHVCNLVHRINRINWPLLELSLCITWAVLFFIASCMCASWAASHGIGSWGVAAFFGFVTTIVYAVDAFYKFGGWRHGPRVVVTTTTA